MRLPAKPVRKYSKYSVLVSHMKDYVCCCRAGGVASEREEPSKLTVGVTCERTYHKEQHLLFGFVVFHVLLVLQKGVSAVTD